MDFTRYIPQKYSAPLYHYTALQNWKSILLDGKDEVTLFASRINYLNDYMENCLAEKLFHIVVNELRADGKISAEEKERLCKVERSTLFPLRHNRMERYHDCDIYVSSFCKESDLLNMWKYYAKETAYEGISVGFDGGIGDYIGGLDKPCEILVYPIVYDQEEQKCLIRSFLIDFLDNHKKAFGTVDPMVVDAFLGDALTFWSVLFKAKGFDEEQEVRIVVFVPKKNKNILVEYRNAGRFIIPYIKLKINKECVNAVRFGPMDKASVDSGTAVLKEALSEKFPGLEVSSSEMTLRY